MLYVGKCLFSILLAGLVLCTPLVLSRSAFAAEAVGCTQISGALTPSLSAVPNNSGGWLSTGWAEAELRINCFGFGANWGAVMHINADGVDSGKSVSVDGVSYKLYMTSEPDVYYIGRTIGWDKVYPFGTPSRQVLYLNPSTIFSDMIQVRFYSTSSNMTPGLRSISAQSLVKAAVYDGSSQKIMFNGGMNLSAFSFEVKGPSCTIFIPTEVKLKSVNISSLRSPGDTAQAGTFALALSCGSSTPAYKVSYSMSDVTDSTNQSTVLVAQDVPGSAAGLGLQVLDGGVPVSFGASSTNFFDTMPAGGGAIGRYLGVQYVRTTAIGKPGLLKAGVTVTLSYK